MTEYLDIPFAISLFLAVGWTMLFSLSNNPGVRGLRNLGILASYVLLPVFLFVAGWKEALVTWAVFGVAGGVIYIGWESLQRFRTPAGEEKPSVSLSSLVFGLLAWPIMVPEAVEYSLAELGILRVPQSSQVQEIAEPGTAPDTGRDSGSS